MWKIAFAMSLKISTFNPPSPSMSSWKHTMRREGDAASKVRWFSENKHENWGPAMVWLWIWLETSWLEHRKWNTSIKEILFFLRWRVSLVTSGSLVSECPLYNKMPLPLTSCVLSWWPLQCKPVWKNRKGKAHHVSSPVRDKQLHHKRALIIQLWHPLSHHSRQWTRQRSCDTPLFCFRLLSDASKITCCMILIIGFLWLKLELGWVLSSYVVIDDFLAMKQP